MKALEYIQKTREYLDYLERHIRNVQKAWEEIQDKCKDEYFVYDDMYWRALNDDICSHDLSKFSSHEFTQYRANFYPVESEIGSDQVKENMAIAWEHHKRENNHHWETVTEGRLPYALNVVHMVIDWLAMSYEFGDTPREYYEANKDRIELTEDSEKLIYDIFNKLEDDET